jgi:hypothetical protein
MPSDKTPACKLWRNFDRLLLAFTCVC